MIPAFHDYSLEPKNTKFRDLLYYGCFANKRRVASLSLLNQQNLHFFHFQKINSFTSCKNLQQKKILQLTISTMTVHSKELFLYILKRLLWAGAYPRQPTAASLVHTINIGIRSIIWKSFCCIICNSFYFWLTMIWLFFLALRLFPNFFIFVK